MPDTDPYEALLAAIAEGEQIIVANRVHKAIHAKLADDLEAADAIEPALEAAGYIQTVRGDWMRV